jgi:hypothetical protein
MTFNDLRTKYGSDANIARSLGVSRQLVGVWKRRGIPYTRQCAIQIGTRGRLKADPLAAAESPQMVEG